MKNIEVLIVKNENLTNTSFGSYQTCANIYKVLLAKYKNTKMTICENEDDLKKIVSRKPDLVVLTNKIIIVDGDKKIWLSEYFQTHNINYTGSNKQTLQYDVNKISSKLQILSHGIETARFFTAIPGEYESLEDIPIPFPLFIKPTSSANSEGIDENSFVVNFANFQAKIKELYEIYKEPVLVEEYLSGREFTVSIIKTDTMLISPIEIVAPLKNDIRILSKKIKNENSEILKEITDIDVYKKVSSLAKHAFKALGAKGFGRIDIKMDSHERCYFVEANLTPGMTEGSSYFPKSYELCSLLKYDEIICLLAESALQEPPKNNVVAIPINSLHSTEKINKSIEIVMMFGDQKQKNVAITLNEKIILNILQRSYSKVSITTINSLDDLKHLVERKPDLVFSGVKYFTFNDIENDKKIDIWLSDYLDIHDIFYIGSNRKALEGEYNKDDAKETMQKYNIKTASFFTSEPEEHSSIDLIPIAFPLFIKPVSGGDSRGVNSDSIVYNLQDFQEKVASIYKNQQSRSLVETYLSGKEYSVGIFEDGINGSLTAMPVEIIPNLNINGHRILDFDTKKDDSEKVVVVVDLKIHGQICALAISAFKALNGKSFARIDIKMDHNGIPHFIEANFMPGLGEGYFYRACLLNQNMDYEQMILTIAANGLSSQNIAMQQLGQI